MKQIKVSQSLIKDWESHINEDLCGSVFEAKYITGEWSRKWGDSDAKALGRYFEFILTGAMPTGYNEWPKAKYLATARNKMKKDPSYKPQISEMMSEYQFAHEQAGKAQLLMLKSGIRITDNQVFREKEGLTGNIDAEADYKGEPINLDIKYSGTINDRWNLFGWRWTPEQTEYNAKQAKQYKYLNGRPTYFLVVSSDKKDPQIRLFKTDISDESLEAHAEYARSIPSHIKAVQELGFQNYPTLKKCEKCPLYNKCEDAQKELSVEVITID